MKTINLFFISGFLGTGKTTFLNEFMNYHKDLKLGIVMNEFGKESVDAGRVDMSSPLIEINNGAIFCSCLKGQFIESLIEISKYDLDTVVVESSGIADPSNVLTILELVNRDCEHHYEYKGMMNVIDSTNFIELVKILPAVRRQVMMCDFIIINKSDKVNEDRLNRIKDKIKELNENAKPFITNYCKLTKEMWQDINTIHGNLGEHVLKKLDTTNTPCGGPISFMMKMEDSVNLECLKEFIDKIGNAFYRIKGDIITKDGVYQVDYSSSQLDIKKTDRQQTSNKLVFISTYQKPASKESFINNIKVTWEDKVKIPVKIS